ncbi:polysaccharide lyase family 7 protein [Maribacter sp. M208]|uniref:polysaccharide lyase family 7 protein n=1 Tax=Maribacter huludaoensis TaxID=3030010 RepID=UPI0023EBA01B|nr:polysaccharide lyase family 7 protein [Maribacter huludaoensis]MDF4223263.1 polysaccharide lyase family 7 protein [Maribacter huludaoensis]
MIIDYKLLFNKTVALNCFFAFVIMLAITSCSNDAEVTEEEIVQEEVIEEEEVEENTETQEEEVVEEVQVEGVDFFLPNIDLSNWKVTLPIGSPDEVEPPEIMDYATDERLMPFMYNDSTDGSLVFYTTPGSSTANSSYSRTELREQMVPGSNSTNWTFTEGGRMKGTLSVPEITTDASGEFHRTLVMQIHGRLTNEQRDLIGEDDNNAPPMLKIYWQKGKVRVLTKKLKDLNATDEEILHTNAWEDNEGHTFPENIGANTFVLEIIATDGRLEVILNETDSVVYEDIHMQKWSVFENYFKAGNYLQTLDAGASAKVKYYELEVMH